MGTAKKPEKNRFYAVLARRSSSDTFGTLYEVMFTDPAFLELSNPAKLLYLACRCHATSKRAIQCLYNFLSSEGKTPYPFEDARYGMQFVFPESHLKLYGFSRQHAAKYFKELVKAGFLDKVESNGHRFKMNLWEFSDRWKSRKTP